MAPKSFHRFRLLPFELRREIYMLATPPRIVLVQEESQDLDEFTVSLRADINLRLNPDLAYFAPNWRQVITPGHNKQATLESFGVTGREKPPQPWEPSPSIPEIPQSWLEENPEIAWHFMRDNFLYSSAPIPALLHSFSESRNVLTRWGYQLAFRTRRNGPRTWFHFDRDVLFIESADRGWPTDETEYLTSCPWTLLGQFHSEDLKRVRNLALGKSGHTLFPWKSHRLSQTDLACTVRLFPDLREVQLVQWDQEDLYRWRNFGVNGLGKHPWYAYTYHDDVPPELPGELCCVYPEEIDALLSLLYHIDGIRKDMPATGVMGEILRLHKRQTDNKLDFFEFQQRQLEQRLGVLRDKFLRRAREEGPNLSTFSWKIPKVRAVHMIIPSMVPLLLHERQLAWEKLQKLKRNFQAPGQLTTDNDLPLIAILCFQLEENLTDDDFHDFGLGPASEVRSRVRTENECHRRATRWWAEEGMLAPPGPARCFP